MSKLTLVIGSKSLSTWSLRPWLAMTMTGLPFEEIVIPLDRPDTKEEIGAHSPSGRVPMLYHGKLKIWDSLAILEYLAESFPEKHLWPKGQAARAYARSVANEMHSGFVALRKECPMDLRRPSRPVQLSPSAKSDIARIEAIWRECRERHGRGGKFLFGRFSIADAMYAPVATRFETYAVPVTDNTRGYMNTILATKAFRDWREAALAETWRLPQSEVA
jgi:glutathione S-transferase